MELRLQLGVLALLVHASLAAVQRATVFKGQTLNLSCAVTDAHRSHVDWKNPDGYIMFFNRKKALRDKRYSIDKLSESRFSVSVSNVTFRDGGSYTCSRYGPHAAETKVEVTVLGFPRVRVAIHDGRFVIQCVAEGNHPPPQISWQLDNGPEIHGNAQVLHEGKRFVSTDTLHLSTVGTRVTVKCLVRHPALHSHLMSFVKIGRSPARFTTTTAAPTPPPQESTQGASAATRWFRYGRTTGYFTTGGRPRGGSTAPSNRLLPSSGPNSVTPTHSHLSTSDAVRTSALSGSGGTENETIANATSTTGWTSANETAEDLTPFNSTAGNITVSSEGRERQSRIKGSSSLLVLLVSCLIVGLLVVVVFFALRIRRAHILWRKENETSDPSEESSKSKSSQEERNLPGHRRRGLFNTAFTRYSEEPSVTTSVTTSVTNTAAAMATESQSSCRAPSSHAQRPATSSGIKETEL